MKAIHFGAGNIGRGFIGQVYSENGFDVTFVDVNETIINALNDKKQYDIKIVDTNDLVRIDKVRGINSKEHPEEVIKAITEADMITTAIGPNILPFIAPLLSEGLVARMEQGNGTLDVIACENMIGGSSFLKAEVMKHVPEDKRVKLEEMVGFPNAAVDRIVPQQHHEDPLFVEVEAYKEWVIDQSGMKNDKIRLQGVDYVHSLEPYIERKLFTVNTGHATVAYEGAKKGYSTILEAISDEAIEEQLRQVLSETGELMINKWGFDKEEHAQYIEKIISRFKNPKIDDDIKRVARTPIRKLGKQERFVKPTLELAEKKLNNSALISTIATVLAYTEPTDEEAVILQEKIANASLETVIEEITGLSNQPIITQIIQEYRK